MRDYEMLKIGLVGCGYWANNILRSLLENENIEVSVLCDSNEKRLTEMAKKFRLYGKVILSTDYQDIKFNEIDAVFVCTPIKSHFEIARHFLNMGKHTFVEKPLTMNVSDALELNAIVDCYRDKQYIGNNKPINIKLMVGHTFRYNQSVIKTKEIISDENYFGKTIYAYFQRLNLGQVKQDISVAWNLLPHDISIACYLFDSMPEKISATGLKYTEQFDTVFATLYYPKNILVHMHASWIDPSKIRKFVIVGEKKMLICDDCDTESPIKIYDKGVAKNYLEGDERLVYSVKLHSGDIFCPKVAIKEPLKEEINHFIDCVLNDKEPLTNGIRGLEIVEILEQIDKSLMKNQIKDAASCPPR
jgi:predicted dehydrogenase